MDRDTVRISGMTVYEALSVIYLRRNVSRRVFAARGRWIRGTYGDGVGDTVALGDGDGGHA